MTTSTATITPEQANLISELLCNAGWLDDADELLLDIMAEDCPEVAQIKARTVDSLIAVINPMLEHPITEGSMIQTFTRLMESRDYND